MTRLEIPVANSKASRLQWLRMMLVKLEHPKHQTMLDRVELAELLRCLTPARVRKLFAARGRGQAARIQHWPQRVIELRGMVTDEHIADEAVPDLKIIITALIDNEHKTDTRQRAFNAKAHRAGGSRTVWRHIHYLALQAAGKCDAREIATKHWSGDSESKDTLKKSAATFNRRPVNFIGSKNMCTGEFTQTYKPTIEREFEVLMRWALALTQDNKKAALMVADVAAEMRDKLTRKNTRS